MVICFQWFLRLRRTRPWVIKICIIKSQERGENITFLLLVKKPFHRDSKEYDMIYT